MIRNLFATACLVIFCGSVATAGSPDEGMWLPLYLKQLNEKDMQAKGLKLSAEDIYSINQSSLKDAVVSLGGFCTAEIVSNEGLLLTNHHCGYDKIAEHSSVDHDYLRDGFWAKSRAEELANPGLTASILVYMQDVTQIVNDRLSKVGKEAHAMHLKFLRDSMIKSATQGNGYTAEVKEFFKGNEYYLLVYEVFKDVRLVGAPPSTIGKFGGETDNWMWPRHTGDFSVFRIYTGPDGKPAEYSTSNIPYKPKKFFKISLKGEKQGDYAMVLGYPGSTDRYLTSYDLQLARYNTNPAVIDAFGRQLGIMKKDMDSSQELKIAMASDFASMSNTHKYYIGQQRQLNEGNYSEIKRLQEVGLVKWIRANSERQAKYGSLIKNIMVNNDKYKTIEPGLSYFFYGFFNTGTLKYAFNYYPMVQKGQAQVVTTRKEMDSMVTAIRPAIENYLNGKTFNTDRKIIEEVLLMMYTNIKRNRPEYLVSIVDESTASTPQEAIHLYVEEMYKESMLLDKKKAKRWMKRPKFDKFINDPLISMMNGLFEYYFEYLSPVYQEYAAKGNDYQKLYVQALREWQTEKSFYPDANSTFRVTYGTVEPYYPRDGVLYKDYTTYEGILAKNNPNDPEFAVPEQQIKLLKAKQFGRYAENDTLRVNFITNNDITGGNSGSPVLNGKGDLIGIAFDGNWESMIGDLYVDPAVNRTICVDIRYVLWVIDEYADADHLIREMTVAE
jgi:hypothetical protein